MDEQEEVFDCPTDWVAEHIEEYVTTDGERGHRYRDWDTLLLTTRGRRSGKLRRTALIYGVDDGGRHVLVASNAGAERHPAWYLNVEADPGVRVQVASERFAARARPATAQERPRLWALMTELFPLYVEYQGKTARELPIVVLERA